MMNWYSIHREGDVAAAYVGNEIGCVGSKSADDFLAELGDAKTIEIFIDSCGGCSKTGWQLFQKLRDRNLTVTVTGTCASAAVDILLAAKKVVCYQGSRVMLHGPMHFLFGQSATLRGGADELDRIKNEYQEQLVIRTGLPAETVSSWLTGPDKWFDAQQALAIGLVNEIVPRPPAPKPRIKAPGSVATIKPQTESEKFFNAFLLAIGQVETSNREKFMGELYQWTVANVKQV